MNYVKGMFKKIYTDTHNFIKIPKEFSAEKFVKEFFIPTRKFKNNLCR